MAQEAGSFDELADMSMLLLLLLGLRTVTIMRAYRRE